MRSSKGEGTKFKKRIKEKKDQLVDSKYIAERGLARHTRMVKYFKLTLELIKKEQDDELA